VFEQWADTLTGTLDALEIEQLLQLIFFHPDWTFRDGGDRYVIFLQLHSCFLFVACCKWIDSINHRHIFESPSYLCQNNAEAALD
jgi:hypothetical protein